MFKKIISAATALLLATGLTACNSKVTQNAETTTAAPEATTAEYTVTTTLPVTTTALVTTTTEVATTLVTTTKKVTTTKATTTKRVVTTTEKAETTKAKESSTESDNGKYRSEETSELVALKYGVTAYRVVTSYYKLLADGSEEIADQKISGVYNRVGYSAAYAELLPAAKENREKYADMINEVLEIINGYRAEKGIAPLKINEKLMDISGARAEEIAWSGVHSHTRPNGKRWTSLIKDGGIETGRAGENIGWGFATAADVCQAWKDSESHYENLMDPNFTETGIGVAADPDSERKLCWAQHFLEP